MPTSRKRRPRRSSTHRPAGPARPARPRSAIPDDLLPFLQVALRADAAEAQGDASAALAELAAMPYGPDGRPYWRPARLRRLTQLVAYDDLLPRWATSRWVLDQALQCLDDDNRDRTSRAMIVARSTGAADLVPASLGEVEVACRIMDRDWVYRQVFLYEIGGLATFLAKNAAPDLLAAADDLQAWSHVPVDAYRLLGSTSLVVTWEHLGSGRVVETANLGAAAILAPGDHVIGRLVPIEDGEMFETAPLEVPPAVATAVAADPASWIDVLRAAHDEDGVRVATAGFHFGLLHDVHPFLWEHVLSDVGGVGDGLGTPGDPTDLALVALTLLRLAAGPVMPVGLAADRDPDLVDGWPVLSAALLEPAVLGELSAMVGPSDVVALEAAARALPEPAAAVCRGLLWSARSVA